MARVFQEFYCGECDGYFRCKINMGITHGVKLVCPNCKHEHHRFIENGTILERGRESNSSIEEIMPPKSSYFKEPFTDKMKKAKNAWTGKRDGVIIEIEQESSPFLQELWLNRLER
jgi:hypothetical protein